jgi:hypothetical protein
VVVVARATTLSFQRLFRLASAETTVLGGVGVALEPPLTADNIP